MKTPRWKAVLCVLLVALMVVGALTVWLITRAPADTDPDAPFQDLPRWKKANVVYEIEKEYAHRDYIAFWCGETPPDTITEFHPDTYLHGLRYYGTFHGYDIILVPVYTPHPLGGHRQIEDYDFWYPIIFEIYAYKNGILVPLAEAYTNGLLTKTQIAQIHQCFERYNDEIYKKCQSYS